MNSTTTMDLGKTVEVCFTDLWFPAKVLKSTPQGPLCVVTYSQAAAENDIVSLTAVFPSCRVRQAQPKTEWTLEEMTTEVRRVLKPHLKVDALVGIVKDMLCLNSKYTEDLSYTAEFQSDISFCLSDLERVGVRENRYEFEFQEGGKILATRLPPRFGPKSVLDPGRAPKTVAGTWALIPGRNAWKATLHTKLPRRNAKKSSKTTFEVDLEKLIPSH